MAGRVWRLLMRLAERLVRLVPEPDRERLHDEVAPEDLTPDDVRAEQERIRLELTTLKLKVLAREE